MCKNKIFTISSILILIAVNCFTQDTLLINLDTELNRISNALKSQEIPPYFIDFRVNDNKYLYIQYSSGNLVTEKRGHNRVLTYNIRVGNYSVDNTSMVSDFEGIMDYGNTAGSCQLPIEDDSTALNQVIRLDMDRAYKQVLQEYKSNINNKNEKKERKDSVPAFSIEPSSDYFEPAIDNISDVTAIHGWKTILKETAGIFESDTNVVMNELLLTGNNERIYYLNTEGTRVVQNRPLYQLYMFVIICTKDKSLIPLFKSYIARSIETLPDKEQLIADSKEMLITLNKLRQAPLADPYAGPSIFSSEAAGVIFHEIFGHRVEGQRMKNEYDGQTFLDKIGKKILDDDITIEYNPTIDEYGGMQLFGNYRYDDEGVKSRSVTVVENGILKDFLMSRTPVKNRNNSNGHGRAQAGMAAFSRQSNLIVKFNEGESDAMLRKLLIKECKSQKKKYGYFIKEVFGGYTNTMVFSPQVFNISPTVVYRIYTDGRPDELVRGVTFIGTPLTVFSEIKAHGDKCEVFNGFCGAESGSVPVSIVSPPLLIKKIETQKTPDSKVRLPLIPKPR